MQIPFSSVDAILKWRPDMTIQDNLNQKAPPLKASQKVINPDADVQPSSPFPQPLIFLKQLETSDGFSVFYGKLCVCHDYGSGHQEDRYYQGHAAVSDTLFQIFDWDLIDSFIYFSHDRLIVPPSTWIHVAHRHGTKASFFMTLMNK